MDLCEINGVEFVIFQGSYRPQSLLVLYTERFNGTEGVVNKELETYRAVIGTNSFV